MKYRIKLTNRITGESIVTAKYWTIEAEAEYCVIEYFMNINNNNNCDVEVISEQGN
jgi:hypothetical protein